MRRIITAREQVGMLSPWLLVAAPRGRSDSPSMDRYGFTQRKLNNAALTHWDGLPDHMKAQAFDWYPHGHDMARDFANTFGHHPNHAIGVLAAMSPLRRWDANLQDAQNFLQHFHGDQSLIKKPAGPASKENLLRAHRVMSADPTDKANILAALSSSEDPNAAMKIRNFFGNMHDPYDPHPVTIDSWMPRGILWRLGARQTIPGDLRGKMVNVKRKVEDPDAPGGYRHEIVGERPFNARDMGIKAVGWAGGYNRMANAVRYVAQQRNLPQANIAQAGIWNGLAGYEYGDEDDPPPLHDLGSTQFVQDPSGLYLPEGHESSESSGSGDSGLYVPKNYQGRGLRSASMGQHGGWVDENWDHISSDMDPVDIAVAHGHIPHREHIEGWTF